MERIEQCFIAQDAGDRLDAGFYEPQYFRELNKMQELAETNKKLKLISLEEVLSEREYGITGGATPLGACYLEEGVPFIRVQNIRRNAIILDNIKYIPRVIHEGILKRSQLNPDDVLLTITGMTYGLSAVVPQELFEANINQHSVRIRVNKDKILPKYLSYFLNSLFGRVQTDRYITGATRPALDYEAIRNLQILYHISIKDQETIIKEVDGFIEKFKKCKREYKAGIDDLPNIVLNKIGIELPKNEQLIFIISKPNERLDVKVHSPFLYKFREKIKDKSHKELGTLVKVAKTTKTRYSDSYKLIDLRDIDEDIGEVRNIQTVVDLGSDKTLLKRGQLVISKLQPESGKIFLVDKILEDCVGSGELIPLEITSNDVLPKYLWCILRSPYVLKQWEFETTGSTRERIGETELYKTLIPTVDKNLQERIVRETEERINKAKKIKEIGVEYIQKAENIFMESYFHN